MKKQINGGFTKTTRKRKLSRANFNSLMSEAASEDHGDVTNCWVCSNWRILFRK